MGQCPRCGKQSADGTRFCTGCGADLSSAASVAPMGDTSVMPPVAPPPYAPAPGAHAPAQPPARKSSAGVVIAIVAVVLGILLLCCVAGGVLGYRYYVDRADGGGAADSGGSAATDADSDGGEAEGDAAGGGTGSAGGSGGDTPAEDITALADLVASSTLRGSSKANYAVTNLTDGDVMTCWAEGVAGYGEGQKVRFNFPREVQVSKVRVIPGYDKYDYSRGVDRWNSNGRVKGARLRFSDGQETGVFSFDDSDRGLQDMTLDAPKKTTFIEFEIVWTYPADTGTRHDAQDTSISEMRVEGWPE